MISVKNSGNAIGQAIASSHLGSTYRRQGQFSEAEAQFANAIKLSAQEQYTWGIATNHSFIGTIYGQCGQYAEALTHFNASLSAWQKLGNKKRVADEYHHLGNVAFLKSDFPIALQYYIQALHMRQDVGDVIRIAESYHDIGNIYYRQLNFEEALTNYQNALRTFKEAGIKERIAKAHSSVANAYKDLGNTALAFENYEASIALQEEINDKSGLSMSYSNIASAYIAHRQFALAEEKLLLAEKLGIELGDHAGLNLCYQHLGSLCLQMHRYPEARKYLDQSITLAREIGDKTNLMHGHHMMAHLDSTMGNYLQALEHYKLYKGYADSMYSEDKNKVISELRISYETEMKDHEIRRLEHDREIDSLQYTIQHELLGRVQSEKDRINTENLYHLQTIDLLDQEKQLQQFQIEKHQADLVIQKAEAERKQDQLTLLAKENELQVFKTKRQSTFKNYLVGGLMLAILLSFFGYSYFITRQKLKLQTLRNKIASDLHDDVGSTLSSIAIFSEIAQQQSKDITPLLNSITDSSRQMLDAMSDIVWTINPENDQFEKIILRMKSYAYELLGARKIGFDFMTDREVSNMKLPMEVRKNLYLIFKEATNNLVKYSGADMVKFSIKNEHNQIAMSIQDNGKGFDQTKDTYGNGLKNMKNRAAEIGAKLLIDSSPHEGTLIQLKVAV